MKSLRMDDGQMEHDHYSSPEHSVPVS